MAIYIHIPFCKQACYYCDFHFSTNTSFKDRMLTALCRELRLQGNYLPAGRPIESLYFGGGTPSLLSEQELHQLLSTVRQHYRLAPDAELTLEANPDDLSPEKLDMLCRLGINRLSIGIQSFHQPYLQWMNRAHNAQEAYSCVEQARQAGFTNISIDLIYGIPAPDHQSWEEDLRKALALRPPHLSAYCLTIEPRTVFGNRQKKGQLRPAEDEFAARQYEMLVAALTQAGYEHYEVSNFALPGHYSRHNSNYWKKGAYLGIGPSAHSYDQKSRQYNIAHNKQYIDALEKGLLPFEKEELSRNDHINEYLMTGLRTCWGCDLDWIKTEYGVTLPEQQLADYLARGLMRREKNIIRLTEQGLLIADAITRDLMLI